MGVGKNWKKVISYSKEAKLYYKYQFIEQEGQHPLTGQRAANFRLSFL